MPRPARATSAIRAPFDHILGTRGAVAVLRVLFTARGVPLSQTELAKRADVHLRGLPMILEGLEAAGLVGYAGRGRTRQVQLYAQHPLHLPLSQLFQAEVVRWNAIDIGLKQIMGYGANIVSAWIEGPVANGTDRFSDPIVVGVLSEAPLDPGTREEFQKRFNGLQHTHHVVVAAQYYQRADLARFDKAKRAELEKAELLYGPRPLDLSPEFHLGSEQGRVASLAMQSRGQSEIERPREIAERIAAKLTHDPELVERAKEYIDRRLTLAGETERLSLLEWKGLLDSLTPGQIATVLRDDSPRSDVLRQSLPFVGVLSDEERAEVFGSAPSRAKHRKKS